MGRGAHTTQGRYLSKVKGWDWRRSWHPVPSLRGKEMGKQWEQKQNLFSWAPKSMQMVTAVMELKDTCSLEEKIWQTLCIKKQRCYFADKGLSSQSKGFSSSHVWIWELEQKEDWAPKNWCFSTVVFGKTHDSPLGCKEIQPVNPKLNQSWIFIGMTDAEAWSSKTLATWCEELISWKRP